MDQVNLNREMKNAAQIIECVAGTLLGEGYDHTNAMRGAANAANVWLNDEGMQGVMVAGSCRDGVAEYRYQITCQQAHEWRNLGGFNFAIDINACAIRRA